MTQALAGAYGELPERYREILTHGARRQRGRAAHRRDAAARGALRSRRGVDVPRAGRLRRAADRQSSTSLQPSREVEGRRRCASISAAAVADVRRPARDSARHREPAGQCDRRRRPRGGHVTVRGTSRGRRRRCDWSSRTTVTACPSRSARRCFSGSAASAGGGNRTGTLYRAADRRKARRKRDVRAARTARKHVHDDAARRRSDDERRAASAGRHRRGSRADARRPADHARGSVRRRRPRPRTARPAGRRSRASGPTSRSSTSACRASTAWR